MLLCAKESSAFLSSEMACSLQFSLSGICILSFSKSHPPFHVIRQSTKFSPSPYLFKWPGSNLHRDVFWVETKWMFDTNNLYWGRGKTDSVTVVFHLLRGGYSWSCPMVFHISDEQACHKPYVQSKLSTKIIKQPCPHFSTGLVKSPSLTLCQCRASINLWCGGDEPVLAGIWAS